jgi:type VI secretion system protein ImpH
VAAPSRRTGPSVEDALFDRGYEFEFFQAVRLLALLRPARKQVGQVAKPPEEVVRFGAQRSLQAMAFPASAVHEIARASDSELLRMTVAFLGLTGTQGVLPFYYTEQIIARRAAKDDAIAAFLDLFNHRLVSLFYRAWEKHRPTVLYETAITRGQYPDAFTHSLYDLTGMGTSGLRGRMEVQDESVLRYAGLIAQRPHSASALRQILRDYFAAPVEIDQFVGSWYSLEEFDRCYLSEDLERNQLGVGTFIGAEVWQQQARFRIRVGPLRLPEFLNFLPGSRAMARLVDWTKFLNGRAADFEVQIILRAEEVPYCRLDDEAPDAPRLGWMSWLKTEEFETSPGDAVFAYVS